MIEQLNWTVQNWKLTSYNGLVKKKENKENFWKLENPGIDPGTSRMLSGRSTIWANSPLDVFHLVTF